MYPFLGITAHWACDEWILNNVGISLIPLNGPHSGENLNEAFVEVIEHKHSLLKKVIFEFISSIKCR